MKKRRSSLKLITYILLGLFWAIIAVRYAGAQSSDSTDPDLLARYRQMAAQENPELRAAFLTYRAQLERMPQARSLPDPELAFGWFISPIETRVGPQQARLSLMQMLPWVGVRDLRLSVAELRAKASYEAVREQRNRLFYEVERQWYRLYELHISERILLENIDLLDSFESVALRQYEVNKASQVDVIRIQLEEEDLRTELANVRDQIESERAAFRALVNTEMEDPAVPDSLSEQQITPSLDRLKERALQQNPNFNMMAYRAEQKGADVALAEKAGRPDIGLGFDYILTGDRAVTVPDNGRDAMLAKASITIPLYRKKYNALTEERRNEQEAEEQNREAFRERLIANLERGYRDYSVADRQIQLFRDSQISKTRRALDIMLSAYSSDSRVDFTEILRLQRKLLGYQLRLQQSIVQKNSSAAYIRYLTGHYNEYSNETES